MTFDWPLALLGLLLVPLVVVLYLRRERRRVASAARFAAPALIPNLVERTPGRRRHLPLALMLAALSLMLVGVARPHAQVSVPREEATIVVAIDVSTSMTAKDVPPTRLVAARRAARRFVAEVPEKFRVGLVSFAGRALAIVPPTIDRRAFEDGLATLTPAAGTAVGDAVTLAVDLGRRAPRGVTPAPAAVVIISDGASNVGRVRAQEAAQRARLLRTPIYTVVLGTPNGTIERTLVGGFREITRVPPEPETLRAVSRISRGQHFTVADTEGLEGVHETLRSRLGSRKEDREVTDAFAAGAAAFLIAGGALSALWFRRLP